MGHFQCPTLLCRQQSKLIYKKELDDDNKPT